MIDVTLCQTGMARYTPPLSTQLEGRARLSSVECFDKCEACERALLARVDGVMMRLRDPAELLATLDALAEADEQGAG